jgi:hypothetical protein
VNAHGCPVRFAVELQAGMTTKFKSLETTLIFFSTTQMAATDFVKFDPINDPEHLAWLEVSCEVLVSDYMDNTFARFFFMLTAAPFDYLEHRELYDHNDLPSAMLTYIRTLGVGMFFQNWFRMYGLSKYMYKLNVARRVSKRWVFVKVYVVTMQLYKRATVSANSPSRKLAREEFEVSAENNFAAPFKKVRRCIL